jgi:hypothetical protein
MFFPRGRRRAVSSADAVAGLPVADPEAGRELEVAFGVAADTESGVEADVLRVVSDLLGRAGQRASESNALSRRTPASADSARLAARPEGRFLAGWIAGRARPWRAILEWPRGIEGTWMADWIARGRRVWTAH